MSTLPTFPELSTTNQHQRWNQKEDQALKWAWQAGASDEDMAAHFNRSIQAVKMRASTLGLGRRKSAPKVEVVTVADEAVKAENAELKEQNNKLTGILERIANTFQDVSNDLKSL